MSNEYSAPSLLSEQLKRCTFRGTASSKPGPRLRFFELPLVLQNAGSLQHRDAHVALHQPQRRLEGTLQREKRKGTLEEVQLERALLDL
jgi:hypothetical protein